MHNQALGVVESADELTRWAEAAARIAARGPCTFHDRRNLAVAHARVHEPDHERKKRPDDEREHPPGDEQADQGKHRVRAQLAHPPREGRHEQTDDRRAVERRRNQVERGEGTFSTSRIDSSVPKSVSRPPGAITSR